MSTPYLIQTIFEFAMVILLVLGMIFDQKIADFEKKIIVKWKARKTK